MLASDNCPIQTSAELNLNSAVGIKSARKTAYLK